MTPDQSQSYLLEQARNPSLHLYAKDQADQWAGMTPYIHKSGCTKVAFLISDAAIQRGIPRLSDVRFVNGENPRFGTSPVCGFCGSGVPLIRDWLAPQECQ